MAGRSFISRAGDVARRTVRILAILLAAGVLALVAALLFHPTLDLDRWAPSVASHLSDATGWDVDLGGMQATTGLWPTIELIDLKIHAPRRNGEVDPISLHRIRTRVSLLSLLRRKVRLRDALVEDAVVVFDRDLLPELELPESPSGEETWRLEEIRDLEVRNLRIAIPAGGTEREHRLELEEGRLHLVPGEPIAVDARGRWDGIPARFSATTGTLSEIMDTATASPVRGEMKFGSFEAEAEGSVEILPSGPGFDLRVSCRGPDIRAVPGADVLNLPDLGAFRFEGRVAWDGSRLEIADARATVGSTDFGGTLSAGFGEGPPSIAGRISFDSLDVGPWRARSRGGGDGPGEGPDLQSIASFGNVVRLDLHLEAGEVRGLGHEISEVSLEVRTTPNGIEVPGRFRIGAMRVEGSFRLDSGDPPRLALALKAEGGGLRDLWPGVAPDAALESHVGVLEIEVSGRGKRLGELPRTLQGRILVRDTGVRRVDGKARHVYLEIAGAQLDLSSAGEISLSGRGVVFDLPLGFELSGPSLADLLERRIPLLRTTIRGDWGQAETEGSLDFSGGAGGGIAGGIRRLDLSFAASGDRIGDLHPWLGFPEQTAIPYELRGNLHVRPRERKLAVEHLAIGRTSLNGYARMVLAGEGTARDGAPLLETKIHVASLDPRELAGLEKPPASGTEPKRKWFDTRVLPHRLFARDADIDLTIDRLYRDPMDITEIRLSARFRDGMIRQAPFSLRVGETGFSGDVNLRFRGDIPELDMNIEAADVDIGRLMRADQIATGLDLTAERLRLDFRTWGDSLRKMILNSTLSGSARNARWTMREPDSGATIRLDVLEADFDTALGAPLRIHADARFQGIPLKVDYTLTLLRSKWGRPNSAASVFRASGPAVTLDIRSNDPLPIDFRRFEFGFSLEGERLDRLEPVVGMPLPPLGPFRLSGTVRQTPGRYEIEDFRGSLGESDLRGKLELDMSKTRPRLIIGIVFDRLRIEDFVKPKKHPSGDAPPSGSGESEVRTGSGGAFPLDLDLEISAGRIVSCENDLGGGELRLAVREDSLELDPIRVKGAFGSGAGRYRWARTERGLEGELEMTLEGFEYGSLLHCWLPESNSEGLADLQVRWRSRAEPGERLLGKGEGTVRFSFKPDDASSRLLDWWSAGLFRTIVGAFTGSGASKINCLTGELEVERGILRIRKLILDTTRVRAFGKGTIDLVKREIDFRLKPRPKRRTFLNLATPVRVEGPWEDASVRVTAGGFTGTVFRLYMWFVTVFADLFRPPLPADGSDVCRCCAEEPLSPKALAPGDRVVPLH